MLFFKMKYNNHIKIQALIINVLKKLRLTNYFQTLLIIILTPQSQFQVNN